MLQSFKNYLSKSFSFIENKTVLVACSGGVDSVVLAHLLVKSGYKITLAHANFSLRRKESDTDEQFVKELGVLWNVAVHTKTFVTQEYAKENKISIQMAARDLRYNWFEELIKKENIDFIATAHHLDDDFETFLINATRGTGLRGLTGIPKKNKNIIRPLLLFSREEIIKYAEENQIKWREDSSNKSNKYLRNKLRLEVIPKLKETNDQLLQNFSDTQRHLKDTQMLVEDYMALLFSLIVKKTDNGYRLNIKKLLQLPNTKAVLYELLHPFGFSEWNDVYSLLTAQSGKKVFSTNYVLLKDRKELILEMNPKEKASKVNYQIKVSQKSIKEPIKLTFEEATQLENVKKNTIFVDKDLLKYPLSLRKWEEADVFYPFGMKGKKKLSKFFKDEKLSLLAKQKIWLLCNADNEIIWIVNYRADNRFKTTENTKHLLKIRFSI